MLQYSETVNKKTSTKGQSHISFLLNIAHVLEHLSGAQGAPRKD